MPGLCLCVHLQSSVLFPSSSGTWHSACLLHSTGLFSAISQGQHIPSQHRIIYSSYTSLLSDHIDLGFNSYNYVRGRVCSSRVHRFISRFYLSVYVCVCSPWLSTICQFLHTCVHFQLRFVISVHSVPTFVYTCNWNEWLLPLTCALFREGYIFKYVLMCCLPTPCQL